MITVRCKECGRELISTSKIQFCGCPNQMSVVSNRKSGRVVYGTGLENQRGCKSSVGSNPTSSVIISSYLMFL